MSLPTKIHPLKRATARRFASTNTLGAENHDQRLLGLLCNLRELSTERVSYPRKITKNRAFYTFWCLSVEIIDVFFSKKVIHSQFISHCSSSETRHSERTQVVQINI